MQSQYYGFTEGEKMQRILLKLSGEALAGEKKQGFDEDTVRAVALQVKQLVDDGIQVGIVIGGRKLLERTYQQSTLTAPKRIRSVCLRQ